MKIAITALAVLIGLLSIAAGAAKLALVPDEVRFLARFGFTDPATLAFGAVQVLGGVLITIPAARLYGSITVAAGFAVSALLIFVAGNAAFASFSLVPVALALWIGYLSHADRRSKETSRSEA